MRLFHAVFLSHPPRSSFLEGLSSEQFAELGSVHLLAFSARACSLAFLFSVSPMLTICRAFFFGGGGEQGGGGSFILISWGGGGSSAFLSLLILLISAILRAHFSYSSQRFFSCVFYRAFLLSGSGLSSRAALSSENAYYYFLCR